MGWVPPSIPKWVANLPEDERRRFMEREIAMLGRMQAKSKAGAADAIVAAVVVSVAVVAIVAMASAILAC